MDHVDVENMSKKSLTHYNAFMNKVKSYLNFHIKNLKLLKNKIRFELYS
jgi:hypothetical protein